MDLDDFLAGLRDDTEKRLTDYYGTPVLFTIVIVSKTPKGETRGHHVGNAPSLNTLVHLLRGTADGIISGDYKPINFDKIVH